MAAYDIGAAFRFHLEKDLFLMIETEGQCLKMNSASEVYENALEHYHELGVCNGYEKLIGHHVLLIEAKYDTVAPPEQMLRPLAGKLAAESECFSYVTVNANHSFTGQRMELTRIVGGWLERQTQA